MCIRNLLETLYFFHTPLFLLYKKIIKKALFSWKFLAEQDKIMLNLSERHKIVWLHSPVLALEKIASEILNFRVFYILNNLWKAVTSRKYVAQEVMNIKHLSETLRILWSHFSIFT